MDCRRADQEHAAPGELEACGAGGKGGRDDAGREVHAGQAQGGAAGGAFRHPRLLTGSPLGSTMESLDGSSLIRECSGKA